MSDGILDSGGNHIDFIVLRLNECDRLFKEFMSELCSHERKNVAAQITLFEKCSQVAKEISEQASTIQQICSGLNLTSAGDQAVLMDGEHKVQTWSTALASIQTAFHKFLCNANDVSAIATTVANVDYATLGMGDFEFDTNSFSAITYDYIQFKIDSSICFLQNVIWTLGKSRFSPEAARDFLESVKHWNSDFELLQQNFTLFENQLYTTLSFNNEVDQNLEIQLSQLSVFSEMIEGWSSLPFKDIVGVRAESLPNRDLADRLCSIDFAKLGIEPATESEKFFFRHNFGFFRTKSGLSDVALMWIDRLKSKMPETSDDLDDLSDVLAHVVNDDQIGEYFDSLTVFIRDSEEAINEVIKTLLTCRVDKSISETQFAQCESIKASLRSQRPAIKTFVHQLNRMSNELYISSDDDQVPVQIMQSNSIEYLKLVDVWLHALQYMADFYSHLFCTAPGTPIDDALEGLRRMIETDLCIPDSSTPPSNAAASSGGVGPASKATTDQMEQ